MALSSSQLLALSLIGLGFLVSMAGFISPFWEYQIVHRDADPDTELLVGLIFGCHRIIGKRNTDGDHMDEEDCEAVPWNLPIENDIFFKAVRVLMAGSLYFMLISTIISIASCCSRHKITSIALEAGFAFLGGITGIAGVATFAACTKGDYSPLEITEEPSFELKMHKGWAFYLSCSGCAFVTLLSILAALAPKRQGKYIGSTFDDNGISNPGYGTHTKTRCHE